MDFGGAVIYAADVVERLTESRLTYVALSVVVLFITLSYILGEDGARLRSALAGLGAFMLVGGLGAIAILSVKGAPPTVAKAPPSAETAEQKLDRWADRIHRTDTREKPDDGEPRAQSRPIALEAALRPRDLAAARRDQLRVRAELSRVPETARTPEQHRRDAAALRTLAEIDRDEGRIQDAIQRYRAAQAAFARLSDPASKRAAVVASLDMAEALDARNDEGAARAAYRGAIADQRKLVELPEPERRDGIAGALVRYAKFETGRRHIVPARAALDEAEDHYAYLRAQRGKLEVLRARAELGIVIGEAMLVRRALESMRTLVAEPALGTLVPAVDMVEAKFELAQGDAAAAEALFARAAAALYRAKPSVDSRRELAAALLGRAEAAFAAGRPGAGREHAATSIMLRRALGERALVVHALVQLALWEAAAGNVATARDALTLAIAAHRETGEARPIGDTATTIKLLCVGLLRGSDVCRTLAMNGAAAPRR